MSEAKSGAECADSHPHFASLHAGYKGSLQLHCTVAKMIRHFNRTQP